MNTPEESNYLVRLVRELLVADSLHAPCRAPRTGEEQVEVLVPVHGEAGRYRFEWRSSRVAAWVRRAPS